MSELTDDQLDGLFRKSAEEFEAPFDPAAWQDMNARLDVNDRVATPGGASLRKNILRWGLPIGLLLLFLGGWSVYRSASKLPGSATVPVGGAKTGQASTAVMNRPTAPAVTRRKVAETQVAEKEESDADRTEERTPAADEPVSDRESNGPDRTRAEKPVNRLPATPLITSNLSEKEARVRTGKRTTSAKTVLNRLPERKETARSLSGTFPATVAHTGLKTSRNVGNRYTPTGNAFSGRQRVKSLASHPVLDGMDKYTTKFRPPTGRRSGAVGSERTALSLATDGASPSYTIAGESPFVVISALTELAIRPAHWPRPATNIHRTVAAHPDTVTGKVAPKPVAMRGLSVRLAVAPDLSGVGLTDFSRPGTNVGLLLEYRLASRWSIQAGVIQSTKVYKAAMTEYALPDYAMKWTVKPEGVDGRCSILDIPINIRYDVALLPRLNGQAPSRWFVSGGVTSYVMKQEDYVYQYADPTNPHIYPNNREWSGTSGSYGFSELNLSAGYERAISRRLSWQVEPFMKVPLKRVGYLKLNLLSTGTFFSLRYKL